MLIINIKWADKFYSILYNIRNIKIYFESLMKLLFVDFFLKRSFKKGMVIWI